MNAVIRIEIAPGPAQRVTPSEILEDFADVMPAWYFEEEDSLLYGSTRGTEAVVLQTLDAEHGLVDFAFASDEAGPGSSLALRLVLQHTSHDPLQDSGRRRLTDRLLTDISTYLRQRPDLVRILTVEEALEHAA